MTCLCCAAPLPLYERAEVATEWEHRLDGYCHFCASMRCDAYPGEHGPGTQTKSGLVSAIYRRKLQAAAPDDPTALTAKGG